MRGQEDANTWTRRQFLRTCGAVSVGFVAYRRAFTGGVDLLARAATVADGYGPLVDDPDGLIDLPPGFTARVVSRAGDEMADGLLVPGMADAMATFEGPGGTTLIVCNHECLRMRDSAFGADNARLAKIDPSKLYDLGAGLTPSPGGTTTIVWDTRTGTRARQFMSLAGTLRNCAGGATPWGSWITCEETALTAGYKEEEKLHLLKSHGWCFEVPARAEIGLADPVPLEAMGRFVHEAVGVDPRTGIVYLTEDQDDGLIYRFIPKQRGNLRAGGRLQALALANGVLDTGNRPNAKESIAIGERMNVHWIDLDGIDATTDDLRHRGHAAGACRFARGEGMWVGDGEIFWVCTSGGRSQVGQMFRYTPSAAEGASREQASPGRLELFVEPNDTRRLNSPDNVTISPWGDVLLCEDAGTDSRLVGVTRAGAFYTFARSRRRGELAGAVFSPDGTTLFMNMQDEGLTLAITGPWRKT